MMRNSASSFCRAQIRLKPMSATRPSANHTPREMLPAQFHLHIRRGQRDEHQENSEADPRQHQDAGDRAAESLLRVACRQAHPHPHPVERRQVAIRITIAGEPHQRPGVPIIAHERVVGARRQHQELRAEHHRHRPEELPLQRETLAAQNLRHCQRRAERNSNAPMRRSSVTCRPASDASQPFSTEFTRSAVAI